MIELNSLNFDWLSQWQGWTSGLVLRSWSAHCGSLWRRGLTRTGQEPEWSRPEDSERHSTQWSLHTHTQWIWSLLRLWEQSQGHAHNKMNVTEMEMHTHVPQRCLSSRMQLPWSVAFSKPTHPNSLESWDSWTRTPEVPSGLLMRFQAVVWKRAWQGLRNPEEPGLCTSVFPCDNPQSSWH